MDNDKNIVLNENEFIEPFIEIDNMDVFVETEYDPFNTEPAIEGKEKVEHEAVVIDEESIYGSSN